MDRPPLDGFSLQGVFAMWRWTAGIVAWVWASQLPQIGFTQEPPVTVLPLPAQSPVVRFEIVMGRLTVVHLNAGQSRTHRGGETEFAIREMMHVNCEGATPLVRYERDCPKQRIAIEFNNGRLISLQRESLSEPPGPPLEMRQRVNGELTISLGEGQELRRWSAASLWHLLLAEPVLCEQEILPILRLLRPTWNLAETAKQVEMALYDAAAEADGSVSRATLAEFVHDLGHRDFKKRQVADSQLRQLGPAVLPYLTSLDTSVLNFEQRDRIRRIRESITNAVPDTPSRIAQWLVDDEQIWLTFLGHQEASRRLLAVSRLKQIRPEIAHFDPYADESFRQAQLAQLRVSLGR